MTVKNVYEIYRFVDASTRDGYAGHVTFVVAQSSEEAGHLAANIIPRYWLWCGIRESTREKLFNKTKTLEMELNYNNKLLSELS